MKKIYAILFSVFIIDIICVPAQAQTSPHLIPTLGLSYPWTNKQLIEPAALAAMLKNPVTTTPLIFNIGAVEDIKGARHIGAASDAADLEKFKRALSVLPKNTPIVIYCGCCPFNKCPNIRPAFLELKNLGFTNVRVLNLPVNLKTNWIGQNYPLADH